ncbi:hypothetical protein FKW77_004162 [Venturia effusa]|uniref:Ion transport domain-containing protein n=1 Tax=Venturia effusa TaxID=50376 RepID=A0A517LC92_9PEZI|nr:hypothetical protein FKW77_004162 [Venturia effusa]
MVHERPETMTSMAWSDAAAPEVPHIGDHDSFPDLMRKLSLYFVGIIVNPHTFEDFRMVAHGKPLWPLIDYMSDCVHNHAIVHALLALKSHFAALDPDDDRGLNLTRGYACEYVAWRFVTQLSGREAIDFLLFELPPTAFSAPPDDDVEASYPRHNAQFAQESATEQSALLDHCEYTSIQEPSPEHDPVNAPKDVGDAEAQEETDDFASSFQNLNALEIAAVSDAKKFLSQRVVQRIIESIWRGEIIFWETLSVDSIKNAKVYNKKKADPFSRLRVPLYNKVFEAIFFLSFLSLYYAVLVPIQRNGSGRPRRPGVPPLSVDDIVRPTESDRFHSFHSITTAEVMLYIWILSFAYDEFGDLNQYFGTLIPCLREMTKDFIKFLSLVAILYLGFLTTFTLLARDNFTLREMSWILVKVFFGSSYLGFDVAQDISPVLGPPLMVSSHLNLLPLLLRPLRLCIPTEQLRRTRIVLLKITHSPFVAAIWVIGVSSLGGPVSSASLNRASYLRSQSYLTPPTLVASQASLPRAPRAGRSATLTNVQFSTRTSSEPLEALVLKLSSQVEELTAMVAGQQERADAPASPL